MNKVKYEDLIEYLQNNTDTLRDMVSEVNSYNGCLEDYCYYDNDEWFYNDFFADNNKMEIARATYYASNYNYTDDYIRFNVYGNLETINDYELDDLLKENASEILDEFLELYSDNNVDIYSDDEFKNMISDYYNCEDDESE